MGYELRNFMEGLVEHEVEAVMKEMQMCMCDKCRLDVTAIALNFLPPRYVVTNKGKVFAQIDAAYVQEEVNVLAAVTKAAIIVKEHSKHEGEARK